MLNMNMNYKMYKKFKYKVGFCFICEKCLEISRFYPNKRKRSLAIKYHLNNNHKNNENIDITNFYVYGIFILNKEKQNSLSNYILFKQKDYMIFSSDKKYIDIINKVIEKDNKKE